ncbi:MAG: Rieske (2Fe-2S) protein [Pseudonocardiaceae bacterium]
MALSRCGATLDALENRCPYQGGPLGEGSIEKGLLQCPWHNYNPLTDKPPLTSPTESRPTSSTSAPTACTYSFHRSAPRSACAAGQPRARQDQQGGARGTTPCGTPRCTIRTGPATPGCMAPPESG